MLQKKFSLKAGIIELRGQLFSDDGQRMVEGVETGNDPGAVGGRLAARLRADLESQT